MQCCMAVAAGFCVPSPPATSKHYSAREHRNIPVAFPIDLYFAVMGICSLVSPAFGTHTHTQFNEFAVSQCRNAINIFYTSVLEVRRCGAV